LSRISFEGMNTKLIRDCKANLRTSQEKLYKQYFGDMFKLCCRYLRSDDLAKEALNAGFLKIFQHLEKFDENKGELQVWMKTIMVRTCIDLRRKELKFNTTTASTDEAEEIFVHPSVLDKLYAEDLLKYIRQLPQATQLVFNLSVIDGYNHKEIAEQLEIGEATSRWHLSEAKRKLRVNA
jgi:RNA polymerase sigma factor (sigma-70 family)